MATGTVASRALFVVTFWMLALVAWASPARADDVPATLAAEWKGKEFMPGGPFPFTLTFESYTDGIASGTMTVDTEMRFVMGPMQGNTLTLRDRDGVKKVLTITGDKMSGTDRNGVAQVEGERVKGSAVLTNTASPTPPPTADEAAAGAGAEDAEEAERRARSAGGRIVGWVVVVLIVLLALLLLASMARIFEKAGEPNWAAVVPLYNLWVLLRVAGQPWYFFILSFVPFASIVVSILMPLGLAQRFGRSWLFGLGLAFLPVVFFPILAFGGSSFGGEPDADVFPPAQAPPPVAPALQPLASQRPAAHGAAPYREGAYGAVPPATAPGAVGPDAPGAAYEPSGLDIVELPPRPAPVPLPLPLPRATFSAPPPSGISPLAVVIGALVLLAGGAWIFQWAFARYGAGKVEVAYAACHRRADAAEAKARQGIQLPRQKQRAFILNECETMKRDCTNSFASLACQLGLSENPE